ncbi:TPA: hypothetical protein ACGB9K_004510 [Pseudomonas aeruginosa]
MTNELTDVRCPCGTEFPAESYDAGFIAGSGMCQNCDAALPPKDICTCPSGDGSLRHPCPAHPAPVEQAGGDERDLQAEGAQGELLPCPFCGGQAHLTYDDYVHDDLRPMPVVECNACHTWVRAESWNKRAALAQPSPGQAEAERPEVVAWRYGFSGGIVSDKACLDEWKSGGEYQSLMTVAQHERIVGALRFERQQMDRAFTACINERDAANARLHEVATACATAEQERDAALARVAELERGKVYVEARRCDECQHGGINDSATGVAACHECDWAGPEPEEDKCPGCQRENCMAAACPQCGARYVLVASEEIAAPVAQAQQLHDLDKQCRDDVARALGLRPNEERGFAWSYLLASIKSCVKAAQAQHSVPEGWMLVECGIWTQEQVDEMQRTVARFRSSEFVDDRALAMAVADAGQCKAPEISLAELLAAAPGKEVGHE